MGVKVGLSVTPIPPVEVTLNQVRSAETHGYDSVWFPDHLMGWFPRSLWTPEASSIAQVLPSPHMYLDPTVVMALAGQVTERVTIGTAVTDALRRHPAEVARTFLTLSHSTAGRAVLGLGAGERENLEPYGIDYRRQASRLEEALHVIRLLWQADGPVSFEGRFFRLDRAVLDLPPYAGTAPPVWIGAHGPRMLAITGRHADGWLPSYPMDAAAYAGKLAAVRRAAAEAGRDPAAVAAGCYAYTVCAPDHDTAHRILAAPLAGALALASSSWEWVRAGRRHPLGEGFEGLRDYVPEWYAKEELEAAVAQYDPEVFHDLVAHGTAEEVARHFEPLVEAGLEHVVLVNVALIAGLEYIGPSREGLNEAARILRG